MLCRGCGCDLPSATQTFTINAPSEWVPRPPAGTGQRRTAYRKPKRSPEDARDRKARRKRQSKARRKNWRKH